MGGVELFKIAALGDVTGPDASLLNPVVQPTNWYVNPATGNDSNDGMTPTTAWKSITKLNTEMANSGVLGSPSYTTGDTVTIDTRTANLVLGPQFAQRCHSGASTSSNSAAVDRDRRASSVGDSTAGSWSGPIGGTSHVYKTTLSTTDPDAVMWETTSG